MGLEPDTKVLDGEAASAATSRPDASANRRVGRYELVQRLGHGGMATVYLGRATGQGGFEKLVAVKLIHPHLALEDDVVEMFLREARLAAQIHHPNVVETIDLGEDDGAPFMVLELVDGESLSSLMRAHKPQAFPLATVARLLADACAGLGAAHSLESADGQEQRLVHRDISPQNLLIRQDGWLKIADFGIAKAADRAGHTRPGQLRGKLAYMSPEQARGVGVDARTDLFALGVIGWELLTGERLFARDTDTLTLQRVVACELPPLDESIACLRDESPEAAEAFVKILRRALEKDPSDRFESAQQMGEALRKVLRRCEEDDPRARLAALMAHHFGKRAAYRKTAVRESSSFPAVGAALSSGGRSEPSKTIDLPREPAAEERTDHLLEESVSVQIPAVAGTTARNAVVAPRKVALWVWPAAAAAAVVGIFAVRGVRREPAPAAVAVVEEAVDVRWFVTTSPKGATVILDGEELAEQTPTHVRLPKGEAPVTLELQLAGYEDVDVELAPLSDQNLPYRLTPIRPGSSLPFDGVATDAIPASTHGPLEGPSETDGGDREAPQVKVGGTKSKKTKKKGAAEDGDPFMDEPTFED